MGIIQILLSIGTIIFALCGSLHALGDVQVTAQIETTNSVQGTPLEGSIIITHDRKEIIDNNSFLLGGKPIQADFVKDVRMSPTGPVQVTFYRFQMPGRDPGLYLLPEVSVKVGDKRYRSIATAFEVGKAVSIETRAASVPTKGALRLEAYAQGPQPIYPGQRVQFVYRFYFQGDIELSAESLPLLDAKGFQKVGDKVITDGQEDGWSTQTITQEVKAIKAGEFTFPASKAEGYAYQETAGSKKRTYIEPKLQAVSQPVSVTVSALPASPPATFTGAVGSFTFEAGLLSPSTVTVEDKMTLALTVFSRDASLADLTLPNLNQSGIKGLFRMSDLPSAGTVQGNSKRFLIDLYPLSTSVTQIPPLAFSYFDPIANQYVTLQSAPIPITVTPREQSAPTVPVAPQPQPQPKPVQSAPKPAVAQPVQAVEQPEALEITGNQQLAPLDLDNHWFGTWWGLLLIPLAILLLLLQILGARYIEKRRAMAIIKSSDEVWQDALARSADAKQFFPRLSQALLLALKEKGLITSADVAPEQLPQEGIVGKVRSFLCDIEEKRFTGAPPSISSCIEQATALFKELQEENS